VRIRLIDTGPFVAYLDRRDPAHQTVAPSLQSFKGHLVTTGAVISEVMYFVSEVPDGPMAFAQLLLSSRVQIADVTRPAQVLAAAELMNEYSHTPMDFADATLVLLADEIGITDIFTLDRRGFSTYRSLKRKEFRLFPVNQ
jgi:uncharacterized protein